MLKPRRGLKETCCVFLLKLSVRLRYCTVLGYHFVMFSHDHWNTILIVEMEGTLHKTESCRNAPAAEIWHWILWLRSSGLFYSVIASVGRLVNIGVSSIVDTLSPIFFKYRWRYRQYLWNELSIRYRRYFWAINIAIPIHFLWFAARACACMVWLQVSKTRRAHAVWTFDSLSLIILRV